MNAQAPALRDPRLNRPEPFTPRDGGFFQRDRTVHPPAYAPGYKSSVLRALRQALLSLESSVSENTGRVFRLVYSFTINLQGPDEMVFFDV